MKLFHEFKFEEFTQIAIKQAISKVNDVDILNADLKIEAQKIIDSLTFTVPALKKTAITSSLTLQDSNGETYSDDKVDLNNNDIFATAIYVVPFSGNAEIFKIKPEEQEDSYDYPFILQSDNLSFKIRTDSKSVNISEEWKTELIKSSFELITSIETTLSTLEILFQEFKNEIIGPVIQSLKLRKEELLKGNVAAKDINVFNNKNE